MDFIIREAVLDDLDAIIKLWYELMKDQMGKDPYYEGPLEFTGGQQQFTNALQNPNCGIFVAEADNKIVGFIEIWLKNKDFYFFVDDYAYILHFMITEEIRRDRRIYAVNHQLYKAAEAWAESKGSKYLAADVFAHNEVVQKLLMNRANMDLYRMRLVKKLDNENGDE